MFGDLSASSKLQFGDTAFSTSDSILAWSAPWVPSLGV